MLLNEWLEAMNPAIVALRHTVMGSCYLHQVGGRSANLMHFRTLSLIATESKLQQSNILSRSLLVTLETRRENILDKKSPEIVGLRPPMRSRIFSFIGYRLALTKKGSSESLKFGG